jgi:predicted DNA binding protein
MYTYTVQTASEAKESVIKYAGRVDGGDFKWTFTNDDDAKDEVDSALKQALIKYKDKIVRTLGISVDATQTQEEEVTTEPEVTDTPIAVEGTYVKTFDNGTDDTVFKITANLKSGAAEKTYDGVNYTTAIKMESSTSIKFSITEAKKLVIITDTSEKNITIDGKKVLTNSSGVVEIELSSGSHEIIKGDSMNVYAFILK